MAPAPEGKKFNISIADPRARIQYFIDSYKGDDAETFFETTLMRNIRVTAAERSDPRSSKDWMARAVFEVDVVPELCNAMGNMHGGAVALTADMATSMAAAPASVAGFWEFGGVSRTLSVTYLSPCVKGSVIEVECQLLSAGARLSVIQCSLRDKKSRKLLALAEHGKAALSSQTRPSREFKDAKL